MERSEPRQVRKEAAVSDLFQCAAGLPWLEPSVWYTPVGLFQTGVHGHFFSSFGSEIIDAIATSTPNVSEGHLFMAHVSLYRKYRPAPSIR